MAENVENPRFEFDVPYNNEALVASRKKQKTIAGVAMFAAALIFVVIAILAATTGQSSTTASMIFGVFAAIGILSGVWFLFSARVKPEDENKVLKLVFYEDYLQIFQINNLAGGKTKELCSCLYRSQAFKQYVSKIIEQQNRFEIKVYTGTYNGVPQYKVHVLPKNIFIGDEQMDSFKMFAMQKVQKDFVVKQ
jgi:hypothetical protein